MKLKVVICRDRRRLSPELLFKSNVVLIKTVDECKKEVFMVGKNHFIFPKDVPSVSSEIYSHI